MAMRSLTTLLALAIAAPALAAPAVTNAWIRLNPVPGRASAGYLTITGKAEADRLTGVAIPGMKVEMHGTSMAGGVMSMTALTGLDVPAMRNVKFAPGGNHLMIYGLDPKAKLVPITLTFKSGATVTTDAEVRAAGADPMAGMDMTHH